MSLESLIIVGPYLKLIFAFLVGCLGSLAYVTALYFKFIGETEGNRRIVMGPFMKFVTIPDEGIRQKMSFFKCLWYCCIGGCVAVVFQFDVPNFVSVQSLILGATWPAIVSQFLSGRMTNPTPAELDDMKKQVPQRESKTWEKKLQRLKHPTAHK